MPAITMSSLCLCGLRHVRPLPYGRDRSFPTARGLQSCFTAYGGNWDNIDAWIGGLAEDAHEGGSLGELNSLIVEDTFSRLRAGDSWWYERIGVLDEATLTEVQTTLLVRAA